MKWRPDNWNSLRLTLIPKVQRLFQSYESNAEESSDESSDDMPQPYIPKVKYNKHSTHYTMKPPPDSSDDESIEYSNNNNQGMTSPPSESSDEEIDNRPLCRYGPTCYRKNPDHIARYRH